MNKTRDPRIVTVGGIPYRQYKFYSDTTIPPTIVQVTEDLCLPGQAFSAVPGEYWVGVWEKAYAVFKWQLANLGVPVPDPPDLSVLNGLGNPVTALMRLTGLPMTIHTLNDAAVFANSTDVFNTIKMNVGGNKTLVPMVAWTYETADDAPAGVVYADDQIAANHSYSILGLHTVDGINYVVLRNPFGYTISEPTIDTITGNWPVVDPVWRLTTIPLGTQDGIFALEVGAFHQYFEKFGWVSR